MTDTNRANVVIPSHTTANHYTYIHTNTEQTTPMTKQAINPFILVLHESVVADDIYK